MNDVVIAAGIGSITIIIIVDISIIGVGMMAIIVIVSAHDGCCLSPIAKIRDHWEDLYQLLSCGVWMGCRL